MEKKRTTVELDKNKYEKLVKYLKEEYITLTMFFRKKVDEYIAEKESKNDKKK